MTVRIASRSRGLLLATVLLLGVTGCSDGTTGATEPGKTGLDGVLLTAKDLPDGWTRAADDGENGTSCLNKITGAGGLFDGTKVDTASFTVNTIGPYLLAAVVDRPAEEVLPELDTVVIDCDGQTDPAGIKTTIEPVVLDELPADSLTIRATETTETSTVKFLITATGSDKGTLLLIGATQMGTVDEQVFQDALNAMHGRLLDLK